MSVKPKISLQAVLYWLFVIIPLFWGILKTVEKSLALFN